ncbi:pleckstrin homology domain-containing family G member 3 [Dendrobates tinctorius]|uniref:pleckstrin homology domain-containing family G member 3 n=1 Tax=Dendrobates tinctorius TaxID=92724 RepID=UPI003CCA37BB
MFDEKGRFEGFNRRISRLFESPRLSAPSSYSNEKLSRSPSLGAVFYDSEGPLSVLSPVTSGSLRDHYQLHGNTNGNAVNNEQLRKSSPDLIMDLPSFTTETPQTLEMHIGLKNGNTMNSNVGVNRYGHLGSTSFSPFESKVSVMSRKLNYVERVVCEIIETERMYVQDLRSIVEDYLGGIIDKHELPMKPEQVSALFGNIEDIYGLNSQLLQDLDSCSENPVAVAGCFVEKSHYFDIYTQYCNNYPNSVATLTECMRNKVLAKFFRERQEMLKHSLPLGSYLLKPVQRILKYHLLLQEIAKHFDIDKEGYEVVEEAIETMTGVAWYINDMKRKHEHAVRQQEIQSLLLNWNGQDLTTYGELVLEGTFRVQRARSDRTFFLFDKVLLITKKRGDHYIYKTHIPCSHLMLIESTRDSICFTLTHYKNSKQQHNVQAKTVEEKRLWTHHIKKLILENHHAIIPQKAKEAILEMDAMYPGRYRYSPERVKKTMSAIDPMISHLSGRRQSDLLKQEDENYLYLLLVLWYQINLEVFQNIVYEPDDENQHFINGFKGCVLLRSNLSEDTSIFMIKDNLLLIKLFCCSLIMWQKSGDRFRLHFYCLIEICPLHVMLFVQHAGSDGALLDFDDILQHSLSSLIPNCNDLQTEGVKGHPASSELICDPGTELSASEEENEEEMHMDNDGQSKDFLQLDVSKGFKRQNSHSPRNSEKRRSIEVTTFNQEMLDEMEKNNSEPKDIYDAGMITTSGVALETILATTDNQPFEEETESYSDVCKPLENGIVDNAEDIKAFSSEEDEEEANIHESSSILPSSVLDQASVIAERFVNNLSRRSSLALEDGKVIGYITPRHLSRSSSLINLDGSDKSMCQNGSSDFLKSHQDVLPNGEKSCVESSISKVNSLENVFEEKQRPIGKLRESVLSYQDRQLIDKIKTYYDKAEHQDAAFSIKRRESLTYIPAGVVKNSIFKMNSLPGSNNQRPRAEVPSSSPIGENSQHPTYVGASTLEEKVCPAYSITPMQLPSISSKSDVLEKQLPVSDEVFKCSSEMVKVFDQIEKSKNANDSSNIYPSRFVENPVQSDEPLIIIEESDLGTIREEYQNHTPNNSSPEQMRNQGSNESFSDQDYKTPTKESPTFLELANYIDVNLSDNVKNRVYQLARQYSQRIKCNKPVAYRRLWEIEEDMRRGSLPTVKEEKNEGKCKLKTVLSFPMDDPMVSQERSPTISTPSPLHSEKSPRRLLFDSPDGSNTHSPLKSDCKSPLSPVTTEIFHWPDVRELRSRYTSTAGLVKNLPVNRSLSVPDKLMDDHVGNLPEVCNINYINPSYKKKIKHSVSMKSVSEEINLCDKVDVQNPSRTVSPEALHNGDHGQVINDCYYISAEAPLENNNKKIIIVEKIPDASVCDVDDTYVHIRSPTSREKISIKAVIERCKAYQDTEEYKIRESLLNSDGTPDVTPEQSKPKVLTTNDIALQNRVRNLREKFQTLNSKVSTQN